MDLTSSNNRIFEDYEPYLVATAWNRPHYQLSPFGLTIPEANLIDPLRLDSAPFLYLLETLDALTFGPEGMPMPRWVFYNGSELPGGIMGFAKPIESVDPAHRRKMGIPADYRGLVPFSMYIAIPMVPRGDWMGHNLASLNGVFPELGLRGLGSITKALACRVFGCKRLFGATQWLSSALYVHSKFGPLDLITAYTPAHSEPMTLTYRVPITDACLRSACGDPSVSLERPEPTFWLDANDVDGATRLQDEIEAGAKYQITDRPRRDEGLVLLPIALRN